MDNLFQIMIWLSCNSGEDIMSAVACDRCHETFHGGEGDGGFAEHCLSIYLHPIITFMVKLSLIESICFYFGLIESICFYFGPFLHHSFGNSSNSEMASPRNSLAARGPMAMQNLSHIDLLSNPRLQHSRNANSRSAFRSSDDGSKRWMHPLIKCAYVSWFGPQLLPPPSLSSGHGKLFKSRKVSTRILAALFRWCSPASDGV